jgi:uncharacterized protein
VKSVIKRRRFGRTGLYVSELSFGAMNLRNLPNSKEAYKILNYVLDQGVNLIDTARAYNGENSSGEMIESEVLVGNAIRNRTDLDEPIVVVTKGHGYTLEELDNNLATSREKLGIEGRHNLKIGNNHIKLVYFFHGINKNRWETMQSSGVLEKAKRLKEEGLINYIGFSSHYGDGKEIKEAIDTGIFDVVELTYNVFNRSLGEDGPIDLLEYVHNKDVGIINMKAFNGNGMPALYKMLREYMTINYEAMLNFCLSNPYISCVDAGAIYPEQFEQDIKVAVGNRFTEEEKAAYKQEAEKIAPNLNNICRECMHCLEKFECAQGLNFPGILSLYGKHQISEKLGKDTSHLTEQYRNLEMDAETCIECGLCIPWCEYKLNIPDMLREAHKALGK